MIRYFCDGCKKELKSDQVNTIAIPVHVTGELGPFEQMIDSDLNPVSGRMVERLACNACYNEFYFPAFEKVFKNEQTT